MSVEKPPWIDRSTYYYITLHHMTGDLAVCMGGNLLGGICELLCKDLRRRTSGFPDLVVWNAATRRVKVVEVKGPGDKLSLKQILWLDVLTSLGADAVVCHVTGVGGKRKLNYVD